MAGDGRLITAIVRGDRDVNETKLVNVAGVSGGLRPATVEEIHAAGMEPGYGSAVGAHDTFVVVDELAADQPEPRRRREPGRLPPAQRQPRPRLPGRRRGRHRQRPRRRPLSGLRPSR